MHTSQISTAFRIFHLIDFVEKLLIFKVRGQKGLFLRGLRRICTGRPHSDDIHNKLLLVSLSDRTHGWYGVQARTYSAV